MLGQRRELRCYAFKRGMKSLYILAYSVWTRWQNKSVDNSFCYRILSSCFMLGSRFQSDIC